MNAESLTPEQLSVLAKPGPWAWFVLLRDGFIAKLGDEGAARDFAAKNHGVLVPMVPQEKTDATA
jgi:hypothetical protein